MLRTADSWTGGSTGKLWGNVMSDWTPEVRLLGMFCIRDADSNLINVSPASRRLVSYLACSGPAEREPLSELLCPDLSPPRAKANLRSSLWRISRTIPDLLVVGHDVIEIKPAVAIDLQQALRIGHQFIGSTSFKLPEINEWALLTHDLLPFDRDEWIVTERERFRQLRLHALEALARALARERRYGEALEAAVAVVMAEPLRESAYRCIIEIHQDEGNHCEALRTLTDFASLLDTELGMAPSFALRRMVLSKLHAHVPSVSR